MIIEISIVCVTLLLHSCLERGFFDKKPIVVDYSKLNDIRNDLIIIQERLEAHSTAIALADEAFEDLNNRANKHMLKGALR